MDEKKLLFRNFSLTHTANCCKGTYGNFHLNVLIPEHVEDDENPQALKEWQQKVIVFVGDFMQRMFNEMVEKSKQEEKDGRQIAGTV